MALHHYIPQDRLRALSRGESLPERTTGAALFADISGFTALTEGLRSSRGERRGIEELSQRVNVVYDTLIHEIEARGGSVISFAGDAITCWFDAAQGAASARAVQAARAMQSAMVRFPELAVKVAVASGPARRFAVGHADIQWLDVLAGSTLSRVAAADALAQPGEVLLDTATLTALGLQLPATRAAASGERFALLERTLALPPLAHEPPSPPQPPGDAQLLRPWILPFVFERETAGQGLFVADLRPATALFLRFTGLDFDGDEPAAAELGRLVADAQLTLQRHGGVLLELIIGDKGSYFYASFGAAQVHEDDAARALRAALALSRAFAATGYAVQIGLSSGTLRVGGYGGSSRQSFGALGDDVNTAARLMASAQPGEILISGRTRQAVADEFVLEARPPVPLKGKAESTAVFAVLGTERKRATRLAEPVSSMPLVGRDAEMQWLALAMSDALQGHGRVVGVQAEAGMGKSRLVAEAMRLARRRSFITCAGACQWDGVQTPYLAWWPIWSALLKVDPDLPQRRQIRGVEFELQQHAPEHAEAWPLLDSALGLDWPESAFTAALQPKDRKALLQTVLLRVLESAAREAALDGMALLLVLEDLHAADPLSADLLVQIARAVQSLPVLVLLTYRPPDAGRAHAAAAALAELPHFAQRELGGLDRLQSEQVIRAKLASLFPERMDAVPEALIERITARAQGNPFFVEELLNYLHDRGIDPRNTGAMQSLDLPASLHSLVLSRVDQLLMQLQLTLKVASIIGRVFRVSDLCDYYPALGPPQGVQHNVRELSRLDFTAQDPAEPELSHLFKHLVTQEVAYESIAYSTRAQLHGLYAEFLEARYPDRLGPLAPQLAHHFASAGRHDKACIYLRQAGEQAAARYANDEALDHFTRALNWLPGDATGERFELLLQREAVHALQSQHERRRADLAELERLAPSLDDPVQGRAEVALRRARLEIDSGDYAAARSWARSAMAVLDPGAPSPPPHPQRLVDALHQEARAIFFAGKAPEARAPLDRALALARACGYRRGEYNILSMLGLLRWHSGDYAAADELLNQAVRLIDAAGDARRQLDILNNLGVVARARGRHVQALAYYESAQAIARRIGDRSGQAMLLNNMGDVCLELGDYHQAGVYTDQAARIYGEVQEQVSRGNALLNRAEAHRGLGQFEAALALSQQVLGIMRAGHHRHGEAVVLDNLGLAALALGRTAEAQAHAANALAVAREIGSRALQVAALCHLGRAQTAAGAWQRAEEALEEAAAIAREVGAEQPLLEVQAARSELALASGTPGGSLRALQLLGDAVPLLLDESGAMTRLLPTWVHVVAWRALRARDDERATTLHTVACGELRRRCERIPDAASRRDYMAIIEHQALLQGLRDSS